MTDLFDWQVPQPFEAKGKTFNPARDGKRLGDQMQRVHDFVVGRGWTTLGEIAKATASPQASVSARLRDLRRMGFLVEHEFVAKGLWRYRVTQVPY